MKYKFLFGFLIILMISGCKVGYSSVNIKDVKMCTGMNEDGYPIGAATSFSVTEPEIHVWFSWANAPDDTSIRAVWLYETKKEMVGNVKDTLKTIGGTGSFHLKKPTGDRPMGDYKVDLYLNEKLVKVLNFKVE